MDWQLIIIALGVARITALIVFDGILEPLRHRVFLLSPPVPLIDATSELAWYAGVDRHGTPLPLRGSPENMAGAPSEREPGWFGRLVSCYHCAGLWVSAGAYTAWTFAPDLAVPIVTIAAVAQVSDTLLNATR